MKAKVLIDSNGMQGQIYEINKATADIVQLIKPLPLDDKTRILFGDEFLLIRFDINDVELI